MNELKHVITSFAPQFCSGELVEREISIEVFRILYIKKTRHILLRHIGLKTHFLAYPIGTFLGDGSLSKIIA